MDTLPPRAASRIWHTVLAVVAGVALVGQTVLVVRDDSSLVDLFSYFTIQSNLLVLAAAVNIALGCPWSGRTWRLVRLAGLVGITVTGVVYTVAIGPYVSFVGARRWYDIGFHYVVPFLAVAGHLLLRPHDRFARGDLGFIVWPVAWLAYTLARGAWGSPRFATTDGISAYPYPFIDVDANGTGSVALACAAVTALLLIIAIGYLQVGRRHPQARQTAA